MLSMSGTSNWCGPCKTGCDPTKPKTFDHGCPRCQEKLLQGLRTGSEPAPMTINPRCRERMPRRDFMNRVGREKASRAAQKKTYHALVRP